MIQDELLKVLEHWKEVRESLSSEERKENLRCAVDLAFEIRKSGVPVDKTILK